MRKEGDAYVHGSGHEVSVGGEEAATGGEDDASGSGKQAVGSKGALSKRGSM